MQWAVDKCSKVCISSYVIQIPSLLDSGSEVTLLWQSYFNKNILPKIKLVTGEKANAHTLFKLTVIDDGHMPMRMYTKLDLTFLWLKVPNISMLITEEPNQVLNKEHQTKLPGIVGWNLIWLSYSMFIQKYGKQDLTHLYVLKASILYYFPNCASFTILAHERTKHWEQHLESCPNKLKIISPQRQMTCLKERPMEF